MEADRLSEEPKVLERHPLLRACGLRARGVRRSACGLATHSHSAGSRVQLVSHALNGRELGPPEPLIPLSSLLIFAPGPKRRKPGKLGSLATLLRTRTVLSTPCTPASPFPPLPSPYPNESPLGRCGGQYQIPIILLSMRFSAPSARADILAALSTWNRAGLPCASAMESRSE